MFKWENETIKRYSTYNEERVSLGVHTFICVWAQSFLLYMLFRETMQTFSLSAIIDLNKSLSLLVAKAICALILHLSMQSSVT